VAAARREDDLSALVVVPARPGPVVRLADAAATPDDIDGVLDELFGEEDERGPGAVDAVLVTGGVGAIVAAQVVDWPTIVTVLGALAAVLGAILPVRAVARRLGEGRRGARVRAVIGDGHLLRRDHPATERLLREHDAVIERATRLVEPARTRVLSVAHASLTEVATLLVGRSPTTDEERAYVAARSDALRELAATLADPRVGDADAERRRAVAQARQEVEEISGASSVLDAEAIRWDLLGTDDR
jgi:hypothetical protein